MIKAKKLKVIGMGSEEYPGGRIDSFNIPLLDESSPHSHLIPMFLEMGFSKEEVLDKLDVILNEIDYIFLYGGPEIKAHINLEGNNLIMRFDTSFPRKKILEVMDKYLEYNK